MTIIKICVAGACGRMGSEIIRNAKEFEIVGALENKNHENIGKSLKELGICNSEIKITDNLEKAVKNADVYISFTNPNAELTNIPKVVSLNKKIVLGTTGFTKEQKEKIENELKKISSVFSPNFSIGINILFTIASLVKHFPEDYDVSISEIHHAKKADAPSGTAKKIAEIISKERNYSKIVYGREGNSKREKSELEVVSLRTGGVAGIHDIIIAGENEMLKIEHTAFSRVVFAQGALLSAKFIFKQKKKGIFTMKDVLGV